MAPLQTKFPPCVLELAPSFLAPHERSFPPPCLPKRPSFQLTHRPSLIRLSLVPTGCRRTPLPAGAVISRSHGRP